MHEVIWGVFVTVERLKSPFAPHSEGILLICSVWTGTRLLCWGERLDVRLRNRAGLHSLSTSKFSCFRALTSLDHPSCWWGSLWCNFTFLSRFEIWDCWSFLLKCKQHLHLWSHSFPEAALASFFHPNPDRGFHEVLSSLRTFPQMIFISFCLCPSPIQLGAEVSKYLEEKLFLWFCYEIQGNS